VSIVRAGFMDHSDSMGAKARFSKGDVQWMTAGQGIVHSEMFPLLQKDAANPAGLFQIWINLPSADKMAPPHFAMLWNEDIPRLEHVDDNGATTSVCIVAGSVGDAPRPPAPPPKSWAARDENEVVMLTITMQPGATFSLAAASADCHRTLYFFRGDSVQVGETKLSAHGGARLRPDMAMDLENGETETEILILQGRPIGEPVASYGPFVMNSPGEIQQAINDFRRTEFGGWPWPADGPVHERAEGRFALHASGKLERPDS
jgi:redox-sensitive bicupin YhaK (pirin superfamily)